MKRVAIIGAGELGVQLSNLIDQERHHTVFGFFDDTIPVGSHVNDRKVYGKIADLEKFFVADHFDSLIIAIGYNHMGSRKLFYDTFLGKIPFASIIHSSCIIDPSAKIGHGVVLYPGCVIDKNVIIEDNVLLNLSVVVSHDSLIRTHTFIAPRSVLAGFVEVGESCFLGVGSVISNNLLICNSVFIGAGAVVIKQISEKGVYVGNPIRKIK